mmetsp:Transcript_3657/g.8319  ORF Transcript_3657/g.8319 Transcript_3657/m.8319 type:complete len:330 (+) Transcript_3657:534-1523(+)
MKPSNILLNSECHVKVADYGLARSVAQSDSEVGTNPVLTDYVATRWYRAPEILLGSTKYTKGVDMWSLGCILGELIGGKPTFPGTSTMNQLERIMEVTGRPSQEDIDAMKSPFAATMLESLPMVRNRPLTEMFPTASSDALDLLKSLLQFNPNKRISAADALQHPYVVQFHNPDDEPECGRIIRISIDDNTKYSIADYRDRLYSEVIKRKKDQRRHRLRDPQSSSGSVHVGSNSSGPADGGTSGAGSASHSRDRVSSSGHRQRETQQYPSYHPNQPSHNHNHHHGQTQSYASPNGQAAYQHNHHAYQHQQVYQTHSGGTTASRGGRGLR